MAYAITEGATNSVEAVAFSFLTNEELIKSSRAKITIPIFCNQIGEPVPGGLYDPALGPLADNNSICATCGLSKDNCSGHFGHIELVYPVYNPLMFPALGDIINITCFSCHHFRASRAEVEKYATQLELIMKGKIAKAKSLNEIKLDDEPVDSADDDDEKPGGSWTSLQFTEAMSVIREFLKKKYKKCLNCGNFSPKITKPYFGWFHVQALSAAQVRSNVITGSGASLANEAINDDISLGNGDRIEEEDIASGGTANSNAEKHNRKKQILFQQTSLSGSLLPSHVKQILEILWENEARLCSHISDIQDQGFGKKAGHSMFFLENIFVPPIRFRPPMRAGDKVADHPQSVLLFKVLESNIALGQAHQNKSDASILLDRWRGLQLSVNLLFNNKTGLKSQNDVAAGICQLLEKKEGIFRQKMMGKRVNFACRSVISPDPYLAVNEIGIPPYFALRLTYPERVTPWNVVELRDAVLNGPDTHPGATRYADKSSNKRLHPERKSRSHIAKRLQSTRGVLMHHGKIHDQEFERKIVYRHLKDGDVVLVNRQPTLHKPSIMAHVVRVLKGEKTVRMHYANCSTYNADFDGDEINVHFPQDEISRAEAYNIVNANNQYVKPTSGEPIRALIQDHVVSAALLTKKDTFLSCEQFNQLLYSSGVSMTVIGAFTCKPGQKIFTSNSESEMFLFPPAIFKPEPLWTGKQVISALLRYITKGRPPFTVEKSAKIPSSFFKTQMREAKKCTIDTSLKKDEHEDKLLIYRNDLVRGVVDKAQFGDYGMVHTVQEFYGSNTAGIFLSALSRLFTNFLQMHGFTCGVDDLLITKGMDSERITQLESCEKIGDEVLRKFIDVMKDDNIDPITMQLNVEKKIRSNGEAALAYLDRYMISNLNTQTSKEDGVLKKLLSEGILKPSGKNWISLMTTSGAKGSMVNFQQISSYLGQQELEGKRVPRMVSGKTLPCFPSWDCSPRAGGFIIDRFLTALRPQEYYFHCMAGREGLVDTAVKTSRSGYLQRCLIKNLESLKVCYDHTVRDSDGSIIQFHYGEDGVDVHQTSFITKFEALSINKELVYSNCCRQLDRSSPYINKLPDALKGGAENFIRDFSSKQRNSIPMKHADFLQLMEHKYVSSLAQPGEPVGVLASQSVGEPATQMTLNTFHLAGRGEMNVTLGIPRLQEIVVAASKSIKTPFMTCPLRLDKSVDYAKQLADKMKKITVADIIESMKVFVKETVKEGHNCRIYKLKMKLHIPIHYPVHTDVTLEDWEETLRVGFVRGLEDAIQSHIVLLGKISGIKDYKDKPNSSNGVKNDHNNESESNRNDQTNDDDEGDADDTEDAEDLGFDAQKSKQQAMDEVEYEDGSEEETRDGQDDEDDKDGKDGKGDGDDSNIEVNGDDSDIDVNDNDKNVALDANNSQGLEETSKSKKRKSEAEFKDNDRRIYVKARGMRFEIHFKFTDDEPHILLAQIAQRTAKNVCIQNFGKVGQCTAISCKEDNVIYYGEDDSKRDDEIPSSVKEKIPALQTSGVHFKTFWEMQDDLNVRYIYSNSVHDILNTYGVEAGKEIIIREVKNVFKSYGIAVNIRHLMLIADFMTHNGGYRPLTRMGIADSTSPLVKMSFETASNFLVEAAYHGQVDTLETPSSRICLGMPMKMGTGCHDLVQKLEI